MMTKRLSWIAVALLACMTLGMLLPLRATAGEKERRLWTYGLGAATGYFLLKKQWTPAVIAGVGTAVAHHNWQASINARHRRERALAYRHYYRSREYGYVRHHYRHHRVHHYRHHR